MRHWRVGWRSTGGPPLQVRRASVSTAYIAQHGSQTAGFVIWICGTAFMFLVSSGFDMLRAAVRPGLIWFIRDPKSTDFQPIREIMEKPTRQQLRKIFLSALLYSSIVMASAGASAYFMRYAIRGLLPLRLPLM